MWTDFNTVEHLNFTR